MSVKGAENNQANGGASKKDPPVGQHVTVLCRTSPAFNWRISGQWRVPQNSWILKHYVPPKGTHCWIRAMSTLARTWNLNKSQQFSCCSLRKHQLSESQHWKVPTRYRNGRKPLRTSKKLKLVISNWNIKFEKFSFSPITSFLLFYCFVYNVSLYHFILNRITFGYLSSDDARYKENILYWKKSYTNFDFFIIDPIF